MKNDRAVKMNHKGRRFLSLFLSLVMTLSVSLTCTTNAFAESKIANYSKTGSSGANGTSISWTGNRESVSILGSDAFKNASDCDPATDAGWYRFTLATKISDSSDYVKSTGLYNTSYMLSGEVSSENYTSTVQYFTHPLGTALRYAWISQWDTYLGKNATEEDYAQYTSSSVSGIKGYNYVKPEGIVKLTKTSDGDVINIKTSDFNNKTGSENTFVNGQTYGSYWIKYAGKASDGNSMYYIAASGKDGVRRLMVLISDVVYENGKANIEYRTVFVTAEEYKNHPEIYQTRYGWPTDTLNRTYSDANAHEGQGVLTAQGTTYRITNNNQAYTECFSVGVKNACCWKLGDFVYLQGAWFDGFVSAMTVETFDCDKSLLYQTIAREGSSELKKVVNAITNYMSSTNGLRTTLNAAHTHLGVYLSCYQSNGAWYFGLVKKSTSRNDTVCSLMLGTETKVDTEIHVKSGETMTIQGDTVTIPEGTSLIVDKGGTLDIKSKLGINGGTLQIYGTCIVESGGILSNWYGKNQTYIWGGDLIICERGSFRVFPYEGGFLAVFGGGTVHNNGYVDIGTGRLWLGQKAYYDNLSQGVTVIGGFGLWANDADLYKLKEDLLNATIRQDLFASYAYGYSYSTSPAQNRVRHLLYTGQKTTWNTSFYNATKIDGYMDNQLVLEAMSTYRNNGMTYAFGGITAKASSYILGTNEILEYPDFGCDDKTATMYAYYDNGVTKTGNTSMWCLADSYYDVLKASYGDNYLYNLALNYDNVQAVVAYGHQTVDDEVLKMSGLTAAQYNEKYNSGSAYTPPQNSSDDGC